MRFKLKHGLIVIISVGSLLPIFKSPGAYAQNRLLEVQAGEAVYDIDFNPVNHLLTVATSDGVKIYDADLNEVDQLSDHINSQTHTVRWNTDGTELISLGHADPTPIMWEYDATMTNFSQIATLPPSSSEYDIARTVAWNSDSTRIALVRNDSFEGNLGIVEIIDTVTWDVINTFPEDIYSFPYPARALAWRPNSNQIAGGYNFCEGELRSQGCNLPAFFVADADSGQILWSDKDWLISMICNGRQMEQN